MLQRVRSGHRCSVLSHKLSAVLLLMLLLLRLNCLASDAHRDQVGNEEETDDHDAPKANLTAAAAAARDRTAVRQQAENRGAGQHCVVMGDGADVPGSVNA
jgi:hypothetical protein